MPCIEVKTTVTLLEEKRDVLKEELGKAISLIGKPESYLMINLSDNQDLYFAGNKLKKGAYVEVKALGNIDSSKSNSLTEKICGIMKSTLDIPSDSIYVAYFSTNNWGWNGRNF